MDAAEKRWVGLGMTVFWAGVFLVASWFMIPSWGAYGFALALCCSYALYVLVQATYVDCTLASMSIRQYLPEYGFSMAVLALAVWVRSTSTWAMSRYLCVFLVVLSAIPLLRFLLAHAGALGARARVLSVYQRCSGSWKALGRKARNS